MSTPDHTLDVRGFQCPLPVLKTRKTLSALPSGTVLEVLATDPAARIDMAHYCATEGHRLLEMRDDASTLIFLIAKG